MKKKLEIQVILGRKKIIWFAFKWLGILIVFTVYFIYGVKSIIIPWVVFFYS